VAAGGDERYLLCAVVAVWIVSRSIGSSSVFWNEWMQIAYCCMNVAWTCVREEAGKRKPSVFPCKVAAGGDERYLLCPAVAVWIVSRSIGSSSVFWNGCIHLVPLPKLAMKDEPQPANRSMQAISGAVRT